MSPDDRRNLRPPVSPHQHCVNNNNVLHDTSLQVPSPIQPLTTGGKARLQCHACNRLLEYDAGAQYVQCFSCSTMNAVQAVTQLGGRVLSMLCAICHTTNLAPYGINYVRCGTCSTISQVSHAYRNERLTTLPSSATQQSGLSTPRQHEEHLAHLPSATVNLLPNNSATTNRTVLQNLSEA